MKKPDSVMRRAFFVLSYDKLTLNPFLSNQLSLKQVGNHA